MMYWSDLFRLRILTPGRIVRLIAHVCRYGIQLANVLHMVKDTSRVALTHHGQSLSYRELFNMIAAVSGYIHHVHGAKQGSNVLIIVDNSIPSVVLLFALSAVGCHVHILRPMKDYEQFSRTVVGARYDFIFSATQDALTYYESASVKFITPAWSAAITYKWYKPLVSRTTRLSIFTSGSSGVAKRAGRSNTLWQYLNAISDVVETLQLHQYDRVVLPVPIYHSYGLSTLFLSLMLNKSIVLIDKFDAVDVGTIIRRTRAEVAVLIPQMIHRLAHEDISCLRCIICCADVLPVNVFEAARRKCGDIIFNLYGTSETGLATVATPAMLAERPDTIGRPIAGCKLQLIGEDGNKILYVKSAFAISRGYVRTGDIASLDDRGWFHVHGRSDDLVVINGVNVFPIELMQMAYAHEAVDYVVVRTFTDDTGFRKIKMILVVDPARHIDEQQFKGWWVVRYGATHLPTVIEFAADDRAVKLMHSSTS